MGREVAASARPGARNCGGAVKLLELHCGSGCNTVALAPFFDEVVAVEINRTLAAAAEHNLSVNGISNVRLVRSPSAKAEQHGASAVLVDPPRAGLDDETRQLVANFDHI